MATTVGADFELRRVKHVQLVCKDIARTAAFYRDALGMRLARTSPLPGGAGQRVVFDVGDGASLAFLWFADLEAALLPPAEEPDHRCLITARGSIEYVKFDVSPERFDAYRRRVEDKGVPASLAFRGDEAPTSGRSLYCRDPDGVCLEFVCRPLSAHLDQSGRAAA
jgi:catechol 2,3-dioxygenase-like lactoylglutathione lyase family enzyme